MPEERNENTDVQENHREQTAEEIAQKLTEEHPEWKGRLFQLVAPNLDGVFIARKCGYMEYAKTMKFVKDEAAAQKIIVEKFLVHPKIDYPDLVSMLPGQFTKMAQLIQNGLGFTEEGSIKNL